MRMLIEDGCAVNIHFKSGVQSLSEEQAVQASEKGWRQ
jgi:hypothetical protein